MLEHLKIYVADPWFAAKHLLMLGALVYGLAQVRKHPGPSVCVAVAVTLELTVFVTHRVFGLLGGDLDRLAATLLGLARGILPVVAMVLLYIAAFGWRSPPTESAAPPANGGATDKGTAPNDLASAGIPTAWVRTLVVLFAACVVFGGVAALGAAFRDSVELIDDLGEVFMGVGLLLVVLSALLLAAYPLLSLMILYRAWASIQDRHVRTTPERAVGFLFIPVFNLYWLFVAWKGFAEDYNAYVSRHATLAPLLPQGLFSAFCVLQLLGPFVALLGRIAAGYVAVTAAVGLAVLWYMTRAINELTAERSRAGRR